MDLKELLKGINYEVLQGSENIKIEDISYDSRKVNKNDIYIALVGTFMDGHKYIQEAVESGATCVVVSKNITIEGDITIIKVDNTRISLAMISANYFGHPDKELIKIGITGTKGKTSTSFLIKDIIEEKYKCSLISTNGIYIDDKYYEAVNTTPSSYLIYKYMREMVDKEIKYLVMEVSSHALKGYRVYGIIFDYGIFTNLSLEHVGPNSHPDYEDYASSKALLFKNCKVGILNKDDREYDKMVNGCNCKIYSYGKKDDCNYKIKDYEFIKDSLKMGMKFNLTGIINDSFETSIPGEFTIYNMTAGIIIASMLEIDINAIKRVVNRFKVRGRCEIYNSINNTKIIIDYAHNKSSMESIIRTFKYYPHRNIITIFGVGGGRNIERRIEMGEVSGKLSDYTIITMDNPRYDNIDDINKDIIEGINKYNGKYKVINDRKKAIIYALNNYQDNDIILLLGKGHEEYQEIENRKEYFNEQEIIKEYIKYNK